MNQGRNRRANAPRRGRDEPVWQLSPQEVADAGSGQARDDMPVSRDAHTPPWQAAPGRDEMPPWTGREEQPRLIATNMAVRLTCLLCAMLAPLAVFMCYAERESRAIRHFAVQSAALMGVHVALAAVLLLVGWLMGGIPYMGFLVQLLCWLLYFAGLVTLLAVRVRMMLHAWRGIQMKLPVLWPWLKRYVDQIHAGEMN